MAISGAKQEKEQSDGTKIEGQAAVTPFFKQRKRSLSSNPFNKIKDVEGLTTDGIRVSSVTSPRNADPSPLSPRKKC